MAHGVKQALVPASLLTSVLDGSLLAVDVRPLVVHVLHGLASAGIERAVVVLGMGAEKLFDSVKQEHFENLKVQFIWGVEVNWGSSLANNILAAKSAFAGDEPLLIVRSDYLFDWRLLQRMARCTFDRDVSAFALIDSEQETLEWVSGAHCKAYCKDGHCHALVKVLRGEGEMIARIGHRLSAYDALQAGIYVTKPLIFDELRRMLETRKFCSVADSMQALAEMGRLRYVEAGELRCNAAWFGHEIMQTALTAHAENHSLDQSTPAANRSSVNAALALLFDEDNLVEPSPRQRPASGDTMPLYALGSVMGAGANGVVLDAVARDGARRTSSAGSIHLMQPPAMGTTRQRVPPSGTADGGASSGRSDPGSGGAFGGFGTARPKSSRKQKSDDDQPSSPSHSALVGPALGPGDPPHIGESLQGSGGGDTHLAVKVVRKGQATAAKVMWEVHVLRQLMATPHPHIVRLIDMVDVVEACYLIMERIDGPELLRYIQEQPGGVLPTPTAQRIFAHVLSALAHAHRAGFVHCDVKPENIRLQPITAPGSEHAVLLDWGYARRIGLQSEPITQGTPAYAAPEQLTGYQADGVSARASLSATVDVWGLGATLCEMLSGSAPFGGATFDQLVSNVLALNKAAAFSLIPDTPRGIIDGMLQVMPCDRSTVQELCEHPWVMQSGALPPLEESFPQASACDECDDSDGTNSRMLVRLAALLGCSTAGAQGELAKWRRRVMILFYGGLCAWAILSYQAQGGFEGGPRFEMVDYVEGNTPDAHVET